MRPRALGLFFNRVVWMVFANKKRFSIWQLILGDSRNMKMYMVMGNHDLFDLFASDLCLHIFFKLHDLNTLPTQTHYIYTLPNTLPKIYIEVLRTHLV